MLQYNILIITF